MLQHMLHPLRKTVVSSGLRLSRTNAHNARSTQWAEYVPSDASETHKPGRPAISSSTAYFPARSGNLMPVVASHLDHCISCVVGRAGAEGGEVMARALPLLHQHAH